MGKWQLDPHQTQVEFSARHLGMMNVRGHFAEVSTIVDIDPDHLEMSSVEAAIQTASISTHNKARDSDLCSSNFLAVEEFPSINFKSTNIEFSGEGCYTLTGDLTIKGTTHPIALQVVKTGELNGPATGHRIGYNARTRINRKDFGLNFNIVLDGKLVVSDEIQIMIDGELVEQEVAENAAS
jgi:polyisoprenoid-binding protein YceI